MLNSLTRTQWSIALLALASFAVAPTSAFAYAKYLSQFADHYQSNGIVVDDLVAAESCGTCHNRATGGGARNAFGEDFEKITLGQGEGFAGVEFLDSDADKFLNLEEIFAQTAPGNASKSPAGRIETKLLSGILTLTFPTACASVSVKSFGFLVDGKNDLVLTKIEGSTNVALTGQKGTVLVRCDKEQFVGSFTK